MLYNVVTNIVPNFRWRTRNGMIWMPHYYWCIMVILLLDYSSTIILQASSFTTTTSTKYVHHTSAVTTNNIYRGLDSSFLQKKSDLMVTENTVTADGGKFSNSNSNEQYEEEGRALLKFGAKISYTSDPAPIPPSHKPLSHFFQQKHEILLRGGHDDLDDGDKAYPIEVISNTEMDSRLIHKWRSQCASVSAPAPDLDRGDYVASVTTGGVLMGGIEITPTSIIGVKLILEDGKECATITPPEFQGVLISNETRAKGPWIFVRLFNRILYGGKNPDDNAMKNFGNKKRETTSLVRVWAELIDDEADGDDGDGKQQLVFRATAFMEMKIYYPRTLSRLLPMGKGTVEKLISDVIMKALEKNLYPAMEQFNLAYKDWIID